MIISVTPHYSPEQHVTLLLPVKHTTTDAGDKDLPDVVLMLIHLWWCVHIQAGKTGRITSDLTTADDYCTYVL